MSEPKPLTIQAIAIRSTLLTTAAGLLLGTFGPFGTFQSMPTLTRYGFWLVCMFAGTSIHLPAYLLGQKIGAARGVSAWIWVPVAALLAALPMTLMVNGIAAAFFPSGSLDNVFGLYPYVATISVPVLAIVHSAFGPRLTAQSAPAPSPAPTPPSSEPSASDSVIVPNLGASPLLDTVPARLGRDILCLQMEDHYVRVHTTLGDVMLHGRMADFEAELVGRIDGMKVHRSWWVARAAVTGWKREDKTLTLSLKNGLAVPVARDRQADVKAAGWLA